MSQPEVTPARQTLLEVEGLCVTFNEAESGREVIIVDGLDFALARGEILGLVGESGSGKTITALSIMRLVPAPLRISAGRIGFSGTSLLGLSEAEMRPFRGGRIGMIFQEPMTALNPVFTIGSQIVEAVLAHRSVSKSEARSEAHRLLELVAIPDAGEQLRSYPHQLSGGQRQRAMIAMALACEPELLIADEPTTALDVTIQAQILELIDHLRHELDLAVLLITHDLAVVAETCDRVCVLYAGQKVEEADIDALFARPAHPYTRGLLAALPRLGEPAARGRLPSIPGQVPDPAHRPAGCAFHPRCSERLPECSELVPSPRTVAVGHVARCVLIGEAGR